MEQSPLNPTSADICKAQSVAFTGYRSSKIHSSNGGSIGSVEIQAIRQQTYNAICALVSEGFDTFMSGMAEGFDMWAAEEVVRAQLSHPHIKLVAIVPFAGQREKLEYADRVRYDNLMMHTHRVVVLSQSYHVSWFFRRNDFLVDNSSRLICYYDGQSGGTQYTVQRANRVHMPIINIANSRSHLRDYQQDLF